MKKAIIAGLCFLTMSLSCKRSIEVPSTNSQNPFVESIVKKTNKLIDNSSYVPLTQNPDGTYSGEFMSVPLTFSGVTYETFDFMGNPIPPKYGAPVWANVSISPDNTMGAQLVTAANANSFTNTFTLYFSGYMTGDCNPYVYALEFDTPLFEQNWYSLYVFWDAAIQTYYANLAQWTAGNGVPKPVYPDRPKPLSLTNYLISPTCAKPKLVSVDLILLDDGRVAIRKL